MTLSPGARLGPYEVVAPIGACGMGQVFKACDTRLGREVVIKVIPYELTRDSDRLARFEREARSSSLPLKKLLPIAAGIAGLGLRNARNDLSRSVKA